MKISGKIPFIAGLVVSLTVGWLGFPLALYKSTNQPLQFNHRMHTGEKVGLTCDACHSLRENGRFSGIPGIEQCTPCHAEPVTKSADEKLLVEKYIKANQEIPWLVYFRQPENVYFSHANHIKLANLSCERCHGDHGSSESLRPFQRNRLSGYSRAIWGQSISGFRTRNNIGMKMFDCTRCHEQLGVKNSCFSCHK